MHNLVNSAALRVFDCLNIQLEQSICQRQVQILTRCARAQHTQHMEPTRRHAYSVLSSIPIFAVPALAGEQVEASNFSRACAWKRGWHAAASTHSTHIKLTAICNSQAACLS